MKQAVLLCFLAGVVFATAAAQFQVRKAHRSANFEESCTPPPVSGMCRADFERWYFDVADGACKPFVYGGCGGNANRYDTEWECQKACMRRSG
uniref:Putative kunitz domain protein n=1 Tax=Amblyomma sculptum TaxID=1581419 RepID=A0A1E1XNP3_AMBSC